MEQKATRDPNNPRDFLDVYLAEMDRNESPSFDQEALELLFIGYKRLDFKLSRVQSVSDLAKVDAIDSVKHHRLAHVTETKLASRLHGGHGEGLDGGYVVEIVKDGSIDRRGIRIISFASH